MQQITIVLTTAKGVVIKKTLIKPEAHPVQLSLPPGAQIAVEVQGPNLKQTASANSGAKKLQAKRFGDDLVIEGEGEKLVSVTDYYSTKDVSIGTLQWDPSEPIVQPATPTASSTTLEGRAATATAVETVAAADTATAATTASATAARSSGSMGWLALGLGLAGGGGGGGGGSAVAPSNVGNTLSGVITAGPVVSGNNLSANVYRADGTLIGAATIDSSGRFTANVGNYSGVVIVKVTSSGSTSGDFKDEATGINMHLDATLLAVGQVSASGGTLNVNPLTTVVARKAGVDAAGKPTAQLDTATIAQANTVVSKALGLSGDIHQLSAQTSLNAKGETQNPNDLGAILAAISGMASKGTQQTAINDLISAIGADGSLASSGLEKLIEGARTSDPSNTVSKLLNNLVNRGASSDGFSIDKLGTNGDNVLTSGALIAGTSRLTGHVAPGTASGTLSLKWGTTTITSAEGLTVDATNATWQYVLKQADIDMLLGGITQRKDGPESISLCVNGSTKTVLSVFYNNGTDDAPVAVTFANAATNVAKNIYTNTDVKVADIIIYDPDGYSGGAPELSSGNTGPFQVRENSGKYELWLLKSVMQSYDLSTGLNVTVSAGGSAGGISKDYTLVLPPSLTLQKDSGNSTDGITNDGLVQVGGLITGAPWQYSLDGGTSWQTGSGSSITLTQDDTYRIKVRQTDHGVTSDNVEAFVVKLDTHAPDSRILGFDIKGMTSDGVNGAILTNTVGAAMTHTSGNQSALLIGTTEADATITFTMGGQSHTATADSTGYWNYRLTDADFANVGFGAETITITSAIDRAGNVNSAPVTHNVTFNATADTTSYSDPGGSTYIDALVHAGAGWKNGATISYSFGPASSGSYAWTDIEKQAFVNAFQVYENICNLHFVEGAFIPNEYECTNIVLYKVAGSTWQKPSSGGTVLADFNLPTNGFNEYYGPLFGRFNKDFSAWTDLTPGGLGFDTIIHELGHGLGLDHPFDASPTFPGVSDYKNLGNYNLDQGIWSVMAYNHGWPNTSRGDETYGFHYGYSKTPMTFDVAALQALYGANTNYQSGDNTYTLPTVEVSGTGWQCIWDTGGNDTISNADSSIACTINLNAYPKTGGLTSEPYVSYAWGAGIAGGFTIADGVVIENAIGGSGSDVITGNAAGNTLSGGRGNDSLTGGAGADHFVFNTALNASSNVDTIADFSVSQGDKIDLSAAIFTKLSVSNGVAATQFKSGAGQTTASDADDYLIYNTTDGSLYYDSDGSGSAAAVLFAVLSNKPTDLSNTQFVVI